MRVMTREVNQGVIIGGNVHLTVLEIKDNVVRFGISSPRAESPNIYDYREETIEFDHHEDFTETLETVR